MNEPVPVETSTENPAPPSQLGWRELWLKEDWWAVWIGLLFVVTALVLYNSGSVALKWIAVAPTKWSTLTATTPPAKVPALVDQLAANAKQYLALFVLFAAVFGIAVKVLGHSLKEFLPSFLLIYLLSFAVFVAGVWTRPIATASNPHY